MIKRPDDKANALAGSITLMVLEPEVLVRMVIAQYLRDCGYRVIEGVKAEDVFAVLEAGTRIDIVFAVVAPSGAMDGFTLASQIRETCPDTDVILTSSIADAANKAGDLCDDGPLPKPYHPQEVIRQINLLREGRRGSTTK